LPTFFRPACREVHGPQRSRLFVDFAQLAFDFIEAVLSEPTPLAPRGNDVGFATQTYIDMVERTMRNVQSANQEQISTFKEYIERQVAANREFIERLLRAKDFQEALRIQVEYFQSQLRLAAAGFTGRVF